DVHLRGKPQRRIGLQAARSASRARRTWVALLFFPVFAIYLLADAVRDLRDRLDVERKDQVGRREPFQRPREMEAPEDRTMEAIVAAVESFPFNPIDASTQRVFFIDTGPDAIGSLLGPNPDMTTIPHTYPSYFKQRLFHGDGGEPLAGMQAMHDHPAPAVVICHGLLMTKNFDLIIQIARRAFEQWGFHVVTLDMRGWGQSSWTTEAPSSAGYFEGRDIVEVCRALKQHEHVTSVAGIGFSLGGASMLNAAYVSSQSEDRPLDGGAITLSAPTDIGVALRHISTKPHWRDPYFGLWHLFRAAIKSAARRQGMQRQHIRTWYDMVSAHSAPYYGVSMDEFCNRASPITFADKIDMPLLDIHSTDDFVVPVHHAYGLQDATSDNPWVHVMVRDAGAHCSFAAADSSWYHSTMRRWLEYWATPGVIIPDDAPLD
ncbi:MAG: alpha/beta fold hydrolase, partial [Gaiellales bacterium]